MLITSELFECRECAHQRPLDDGPASFDLTVGMAKFPMGKLKVVAHVPAAAPSTITTSEEPSGEWYVSFCCGLPSVQSKNSETRPHVLRTQEELMYEFGPRDQLDTITVGMDLGVAMPVADSARRAFDIAPACRKRIDKKEDRIARLPCDHEADRQGEIPATKRLPAL